ncbi:hypothetical protein [Kribbella italica]|uniref:Uncharacterized protein n=1 Tax=Kribbella italica TaxID=1540520 RepID=A0A7W9MUK6_9ACTN|nr:hypothetical protein [Kribbella italica]MBB5836327.1 hypothetical protein [Kribbella italica]
MAAVLEADDFAVRRAAVFGLELAVDQPVGRSECVVSAGLWKHRQLDLRAVAEVVGHETQALAVEVRLLAVGDGTQAGAEGAVLAVA